MPPWLQPHAQTLEGMWQRGKLPQSLLVHGVPGTGRQLIGLWLAARLLGTDLTRLVPAPEHDAACAGHPDFLRVEPVEKPTIVVDQVRDLISFLQLKSHQGGARVALVTPAEAMNANAANSLLKTLEEPPAGSTIILVTGNLAGLPATIVSRCHRVRIRIPRRETALAWLGTQADSIDWPLLLDCAGGAPFLARDLHQAGFARQLGAYEAALCALREGTATPTSIARQLVNDDPTVVLRYLYWRTASSLRELLTEGARESSTRALQKQTKESKIRGMFVQLRAIEELRRHRAKSLNAELQLAAVLAGWCGDGLTDRKSTC